LGSRARYRRVRPGSAGHVPAPGLSRDPQPEGLTCDRCKSALASR
jgi:hypothetical protein